jgi:hypothetical protein
MPAPKVVNYEGGSDARYDTGAMVPVGDGRLTDGTYYYDGEGRPLDAIPGGNDWTDGLPGARGGGSPTDGGGGGGGGNPFAGNPYFQQYQSQLQAQQAADLAGTKSQLQQLLIGFGLIPDGFQDQMGALDDTIKALIAKNTESGISQYARILQGKQDTQRESISGLGARGLLRSGAKGYKMRRNQLSFDQILADALSAVLGNASSLQSGYASRELQRQTDLSSWLAQLAQSYQPPRSSSPGPRPPAQPDYSNFDPFTNQQSPSILSGWAQAADYVNNGMWQQSNSAPATGGGYTSPKKPILPTG